MFTCNFRNLQKEPQQNHFENCAEVSVDQKGMGNITVPSQ